MTLTKRLGLGALLLVAVALFTGSRVLAQSTAALTNTADSEDRDSKALVAFAATNALLATLKYIPEPSYVDAAKSDLKQVALAVLMFSLDFDETLPIGLVDGECGNLPYFGIAAYLKNGALLQNYSQGRYDDGLADYVYLMPPLGPKGFLSFDCKDVGGTAEGLYLGAIPDAPNTVLILGKMKDYDRWLIAFADGHVKVYSSETDLPNGLHTPGSNPSIMQLWHGLLYGYGFEAKIPSPSLLARGAFAAQRLAVLLQQQNPGRYSAPELAAYLQNRETLQSLFNAIDADADAQLSLDELLSYDLGLAVVVFPPGGGGRPDVGSDGPGADGYPVEVLEFLGAAAGELQALINADLCAAGADSCVGNFGYEDFLAASGNGLFSLSTLRSLTKEFVTQAGVANSLCAKLDAAEAAGKRGQAKVKAQTLRAYLNQLRAQTGVTVAADRAGTLTFLVQGL